jgi:hypothetical protein
LFSLDLFEQQGALSIARSGQAKRKEKLSSKGEVRDFRAFFVDGPVVILAKPNGFIFATIGVTPRAGCTLVSRFQSKKIQTTFLDK